MLQVVPMISSQRAQNIVEIYGRPVDIHEELYDSRKKKAEINIKLGELSRRLKLSQKIVEKLYTIFSSEDPSESIS